MTCPQHGPDCIWYQHNSDRVGTDLGYGDGWSNARDFAHAHEPMINNELPVSDMRGDYFALGFFTGVTAAWCPIHTPEEGCLGHWRCHKAVQELVATTRMECAS